MNEPLVSIIIPTYNSERTIAKCLMSIKKQSYSNIEVIVVDRFSKDKTAVIAKEFGAKVIFCNCERMKAKNIGLKEARGKYVCFIDSDMELSRNVISDCLSIAERDESIGGVIIPEITVGQSFWARVRAYERALYAGTDVESARWFRRSLALKVGGFDEDILFFEEKTLQAKISELGFNTEARINSMIIHHEENFTLKRWIKKKYEYGKTFWKYVQRYSRHIRPVNLFYRLKLILHGNHFCKNPFYILAVLILKYIEFFSILLGLTVSAVGHLRETPK